MKKSIFSYVSVLSLSLLFSACSKNDSGLTQTDNSNPSQASAAVSGSFTLTSFVQRNEDKTGQFDGYVFTFTSTSANAGNVVAVKGSNTVSGTWVYAPGVTYYGSTSKTSITLNLGATTPFTLLNKTWNVDNASTSSKLALSSPELAEDEHIAFTKQ